MSAYLRAIGRVYGLEPRGIRPGVSRVRAALARLGHPQKRFPAVLVAGTNGKGSVCAMVERSLRSMGLKTGLYTSPHLHRFTERIQIDGRPVARRDVVRAVDRLSPVLFDPVRALTFFEATTVLAFDMLARARVNVAVIEVGLGGRLDATTVVTPVASAIVSIGIDHTDKLGHTRAQIAWEKAGILRAGVPTVVGPLSSSARETVEAEARKRRAPLRRVGREIRILRSRPFRVRGRRLDVEVPSIALAGPHQRENAAVVLGVLECLEGLEVTERAVREGWRRVHWPGRLEQLAGRPRVVLDMAHNAHACGALRRALEGAPSVVTVIGVLRDKRAAAMVRALGPLAGRLVWCHPRTSRAADPRPLAVRLGGEVVPDPVEAFRRARAMAGRWGTVLVCGSIFVVGPVRAALLGIREDPPIAM